MTDRRTPAAAPLLVALLFAAAPAARAELALSFLFGGGALPAFEVDLAAAGTATLTAESTVDTGYAFSSGRVAWWRERGSSWGLALEGTWSAETIDLTDELDPASLPADLSGLDADVRLYPVLLTALRRWEVGRPDALGLRPTFHLGAGAGAAVARAESSVGGQSRDSLEVAGPAIRALAGFETPLWSSVLLVLEGPLTWQSLDLDLVSGARLDADLWSPEAVLGIVVRD